MLDLRPPLFVSMYSTVLVSDGRTFDLMFSKLAGEVREKQSRKTSVWGYDSGRSRLFMLAFILPITHGRGNAMPWNLLVILLTGCIP